MLWAALPVLAGVDIENGNARCFPTSAPGLTSASISAAPPLASRTRHPESVATRFSVYQTKPTTSVQVRLADGTRFESRDTNTRPLAHADCSAGFSALACVLELWAWHADTEGVAWQLGRVVARDGLWWHGREKAPNQGCALVARMMSSHPSYRVFELG
jgi:hypothetical protein